MSSQYVIGLPVEQLPTPALVLDIEALTRNIETMSNYLAKVKTNIRPHAKSHKTPAIAHLQMRAGAIGQCCQTVGEAEVMAYAGISDLLIASEVVGEVAIRRTVNLARQAKVMTIVDELANVGDLSAAARQYGANLDILVDLDVGQHRCGARSLEQLVELAKAVDRSPGLTLRGVFGYEGHIQFIADREERTKLGQAASTLLVQGAKAVAGAGLNVEIVSGAGTGTYDIAAEFPEITEIQAGSYIFMDGTYQKLGLPFEQSLTVLGQVVSRPSPDMVIFDVGLKGISPERFMPAVQGYEKSITVQKLSEEHATAQLLEGDLRSGDKVRFVPSHCCTTVNLYDYMYVTRKGIIEAIWPIAARRA
jgi:D-serine deaminase-like pyridoxal phosphate-dependent protein